MYDENSRSLCCFFGLKSGIAMSTAEAVECLLDFSKGPEAALVATVDRQAFVGFEEGTNYIVLEAKQKLTSDNNNSDQKFHNSSAATNPSSESQRIASANAPKARAVCTFCGKSFSHLGDHNKHRRRHTGERPYNCELCPKRFAHASNLTRHRRLHSGEKPFECTDCSRSFSRRDKLASHVARRSCCKNTGRPKVTTV